MALNDVKISQLPVQDLAELTDDTIFITVDSNGLNKQVALADIVQYTANNIAVNRPLGEMSLTTVAPAQTFDDLAYTVVTAFDKVQYERDVDVDLGTDTITILEDGEAYRTTVFVNAEFDNNATLELVVLIDGVETETFGPLLGRGNNKPVSTGSADIDPMVSGQTIQLAARRGEAGSIDVIFHKVRIIVERV